VQRQPPMPAMRRIERPAEKTDAFQDPRLESLKAAPGRCQGPATCTW
jgi:hypothetical protein